MAAIEERGEVAGAELAKLVPELDAKIAYGEGKTWAGTFSMTTRVLFLLSLEQRVVRGRPRGSWINSQYRWSPMPAWPRRPAASRGRRTRRARAPLALRVRARAGDRHQVVDGADPRRGAQGDRRARRRGGRPRRHDRGSCWPTTSRPCVRRRRGSRSCPASTRRRWAGTSATGTSATTRRSCSTPPATRGRPCGATGASSARGRSARAPARSASSCSRTSGARPQPRSRPRRRASPTWMDGVKVTPRFGTPLEISLR